MDKQDDGNKGELAPLNKETVDQLCLIHCFDHINGKYGDELIQTLVTLVDDEGFGPWQAVAVDLRGKHYIETEYVDELVRVGRAIKKLGKRLFIKDGPVQFSMDVKSKGLNSIITPIAGMDQLKEYTAKPVSDAPKRPPKIDVEFINPFIGAVIETLKTQCSVEVKPGSPFLKMSKIDLDFDVAASMNLSSNGFNGTISLCLKQPMFLAIMNGMLGEEYEEISQDLIDGIAEVLNITFGVAKKTLNEKNYEIQKAIPKVVEGKEVRKLLNDSRVGIVLPFSYKGANKNDFYLLISLNS